MAPVQRVGVSTRMFRRLLFYSALPALLAANLWWFSYFLDLNYLHWYLQEGPLISLSIGLLSLFWEELEARRGLLSVNPAIYLGSCLQLVGILFQSMGVHLQGTRISHKTDLNGAQLAIRVWDSLVSMLLVLVVLGFLTAWTLVVAPLNYLVTLVTGAPARSYFRGLSYRSMVSETDGQVVFTVVSPGQQSTPRKPAQAPAVDISFARKPFALNQALTALVLWGVGLLVN